MICFIKIFVQRQKPISIDSFIERGESRTFFGSTCVEFNSPSLHSGLTNKVKKNLRNQSNRSVHAKNGKQYHNFLKIINYITKKSHINQMNIDNNRKSNIKKKHSPDLTLKFKTLYHRK